MRVWGNEDCPRDGVDDIQEVIAQQLAAKIAHQVATQLEPRFTEEWLLFKNKWYAGPLFGAWRSRAAEVRRQKDLLQRAIRRWEMRLVKGQFDRWAENVGRFPFGRDPREHMCRLGLFFVTCQVVLPEEKARRDGGPLRLRGGICDTPVPEIPVPVPNPLLLRPGAAARILEYVIPSWFTAEPSLQNTCQAVWVWQRARLSLKAQPDHVLCRDDDPMGVLASPDMLPEVLRERIELGWEYILDIGASCLRNSYQSHPQDAAFVILALTSSLEAGLALSPEQESIAKLAEAGMRKSLSMTGVSPPPRGYGDQKLHSLFLTAYAKAAGRADLIEYCKDRLQRLIFYPGPLPVWWDGEIGPGRETARQLPSGTARASLALGKFLNHQGAVSAWGSAVGAVALCFEDDQAEAGLPFWAGKVCSGEEGRGLPMDFLPRANGAVPFNCTLLLGLRGLLRALDEDNTLASPLSPPGAPTEERSGARVNLQEAMKRLGWQIKPFVDEASCCAAPDGDTASMPQCWVGFLLAYSLFAFSTRSAHPKFVTPVPVEKPRKDYKALAAYLERTAIHNERVRSTQIEADEFAAHPASASGYGPTSGQRTGHSRSTSCRRADIPVERAN